VLPATEANGAFACGLNVYVPAVAVHVVSGSEKKVYEADVLARRSG
jgi:hypothetical protein